MIIAHSDAIDSTEATVQILAASQEQLAGLAPVGALLFAGIGYQHELILAGIQQTWPGLPLIGCTTDGEFSAQGGYHNDSVLLVLFGGADIEASMGVGRGLSLGVTAAVQSALSSARSGQQSAPSVCLTTPESMTANCTEITAALHAILGESNCPILGGVSGDHRRFETTFQFAGAEVLSDSLPVLLLFGDVEASWGVDSGWQAVGGDHKVTKAEGNIVRTIDERPALDVFADYWGDASNLGILGQFPLAIFPDPSRPDEFYLRAVFSTDPESGSAVFAADVPEGTTVRMTQVLTEGILDGSASAMQQALAGLKGRQPKGALVFSCAARKWLLGTRVGEELQALKAACPAPNLPLAGFYAFGEIAPLRAQGVPFYHNETCIAVLFTSRSRD